MSQDWNAEIAAAGGLFYQGTRWGSFKEALGHRVVRYHAGGLYAQVLLHQLPGGLSYWYIPMGPLSSEGAISRDEIGEVIQGIPTQGASFLQADLCYAEDGAPTQREMKQPEAVSVVEIRGVTEEQLWQRYHPTLRQNIERAQKSQIRIERETDLSVFTTLHIQTMRRHGLRWWPASYLEALRGAMEEEVELWSAYDQDGTIRASHLYILFGSRVTHLYGGSHREALLAPHLLHHHMMQEFAMRGFAEYDLGKVDPKRLPSLTVFKSRFGGRVERYPGAYLHVFRPHLYLLYRAARRLHSSL